MYEREITGGIIEAASQVHKQFGPGLLESVYEEAMFSELPLQGLRVARQVPIPLLYKGRALGNNLKLDFLVEDRIIVELKAVTALADIHVAQALTYLKLTGKKTCLLINFNVLHLRAGGLRRISL